jgi:hypothetical protein
MRSRVEASPQSDCFGLPSLMAPRQIKVLDEFLCRLARNTPPCSQRLLHLGEESPRVSGEVGKVVALELRNQVALSRDPKLLIDNVHFADLFRGFGGAGHVG